LILPVEDEKLGQKMVLLVDKEIGDQWRSILSQSLAAHELPKKIIRVSELPRNAAHKPDRKAARAFLSE